MNVKYTDRKKYINKKSNKIYSVAYSLEFKADECPNHFMHMHLLKCGDEQEMWVCGVLIDTEYIDITFADEKDIFHFILTGSESVFKK